MTTPETRMRIGATRIGLTLAAYRAHIENGERWCYACQQWHPISEMTRRRSRTDGIDNICRWAANIRTHAWLRRKTEAAS